MSICTMLGSAAVIVLAGATTLGCAGSSEDQSEGPPLSSQEIRQLIVGNTVSGAVVAQQYSFYYTDNGKVSGSIDARDDDSGTWLIKDGNVYCHQWIDFFDGVQHCFQWMTETNGRYLMKNVDVDRGRSLEVWKIENGNPLGF